MAKRRHHPRNACLAKAFEVVVEIGGVLNAKAFCQPAAKGDVGDVGGADQYVG